MATSSDRSGPSILYLLTSDVSHVLVRGQLGFLCDRGADITVGVGVGDREAGATAVEWDPGVHVEHVPFVREVSLLRDVRALGSTLRLIRRVRPDLVNASTPKAGLLGMLAARACRVPVRVYVIRGLRFETSSGWRRRVLRATDRVAARCATHVLANSESVLRVARSERVVRRGVGDVIGSGSGNGVDLDRFAPPSADERAAARAALDLDEGVVAVGFVGRLTHDKGIADLVDEFTTRFAGRDDVRLLLVGDFEPGDPVDGATRQAIDDDDRIRHIGWVGDTRAMYWAVDLLAFPSLREGLPNVPLEAQASGVSVVGYASTGTVDAVDDGRTGVLVPTGDKTALGAALVDIIDRPDRRRVMGSAARNHMTEHFDRRRIHAELALRYERWLADATA